MYFWLRSRKTWNNWWSCGDVSMKGRTAGHFQWGSPREPMGCLNVQQLIKRFSELVAVAKISTNPAKPSNRENALTQQNYWETTTRPWKASAIRRQRETLQSAAHLADSKIETETQKNLKIPEIAIRTLRIHCQRENLPKGFNLTWNILLAQNRICLASSHSRTRNLSQSVALDRLLNGPVRAVNPFVENRSSWTDLPRTRAAKPAYPNRVKLVTSLKTARKYWKCQVSWKFTACLNLRWWSTFATENVVRILASKATSTADSRDFNSMNAKVGIFILFIFIL